MAYKHLIQKDSPYLFYPLDTTSFFGEYFSFGTVDDSTAKIVNSNYVFQNTNTLTYYNYPLVLGNNISHYVSSNKRIRTKGLGFFTKKNISSSYSIEFWMRHYDNAYNTPFRIVSASSSNYSGLWMDGQYLIYKYGDEASSLVQCSVPVEKYDEPLHVIMTFDENNICLSVNNIKSSVQINPDDISINNYDANKDYLFFGGLNNLELSCIALYGYNILESGYLSITHYLYGQGYDVPPNQYESRGGINNSMNIQYSYPKVILDYKTKFDGRRYTSTWDRQNNMMQYGTVISEENGLTVSQYIFDGVRSVSDLSRVAATANGTPLEKGSYILFNDIKTEIVESPIEYAFEITGYHSSTPAVSASNTLLHIQNEIDQSYIWVHMSRQTSTTSNIFCKVYDRNGSLIYNQSIMGGTYIPINQEFKFGIGRRLDSTDGTPEIFIFGKYNNTTSSVEFSVNSNTYNFLQNIKSLRVGSMNVYDDLQSLSEISNDYSWSSSNPLYISSILIGESRDILNRTYSKYYRKMAFDYEYNKFNLGVYNASAVIPISYWSLGDEVSGSFIIYPNRLDFSYPSQSGSTNASTDIKINKYIYNGTTLSSSARIYNSTDIFVQPKTYLSKDDVSASTVQIGIIMNSSDIEYKKPVLKSISLYSLSDNLIRPSNDMQPIKIFYGESSKVSLPQYSKTSFINNAVSDGGILIGDTDYYGLIDVGNLSMDEVNTISFFVKSASLYNSTIVQLSGSNLFQNILNGASAFVNTALASVVYRNGASVSLSTGSISTTTTEWNRYDIVLKQPLTAPASIVIGATSGTNNRFYIDEFAVFNKKFTASDSSKIKNLYKSGFTSSEEIKDGAAATIDMSATYGTSSSSKVMLAFFDKETQGASLLYTDKIQLFTKETLTNARAVKIQDSSTTNSYDTFTTDLSEQYVDGVQLLHGDKVLVLTESTSSGLYTASYSDTSLTSIKFTSSVQLTSKDLYFVSDGQMFGQKYISMDNFSGSLLPNIEVDNAKIKYMQFSANEE